MTDLEKIGRLVRTDKINYGYLKVYNEYFKEIKNNQINILELGVLDGASALAWRIFFNNANIYGLDIEDKTNIFNSLWGNTRFFLGDQSNELHIDYLIETVKTSTGKGFDIIIDDGSHFQYDMMKSLGLLYPHLNSNGIYIIEDMATSEELKNGARWWGSADENHSLGYNPGLQSSIGMNKKWLPNNKKDLYYCAETTIQRFEETGIFDSAFLSKEQNKYITEETKKVDFYKANKEPITGTSSICVLRKNKNDIE